jgi:NAD(P)H dehydrogenase (quinone)
MNALIVYAHPEPRSFNGAMRDLAVQVLTELGHDVRVSDLYAAGFEAAGGRTDFTDLEDPEAFRYQREQIRASQAGTFAPQLMAEIDAVRWADLLILQFPLWWFSLPGILKGWVDRVFAMGFAYGYGETHSSGPLRGKRAMLAFTTGSPAATYSASGANGDLDRLLFPIQYGILHFVGMDVLPPFVAYGAARIDNNGRTEYLRDYRRRLETVEHAVPLTFDVADTASRSD